MPKTTSYPLSPVPAVDDYLAQENARWGAAFRQQPSLTRRLVEGQAQSLAEALLAQNAQVSFRLPDQVIVAQEGQAEGRLESSPAEAREQMVGGLIERLTRTALEVMLRGRLDELEAGEPAVATAAGLLRFATASTLVENMLPSGRRVQYQALEGEEIACMPLETAAASASAITQSSDAIVEDEPDADENGRGELQVPYVPEALRFYLPQWVALDNEDRLLVSSLAEAESRLASMQRFLRVLHMAVGLAPYMVASPEYQQKRYGILGQLVNQGRALARYETGQIISAIQRRAVANDLNRGLSVSLPYFDDQALEMKTHDFQIIPAGRIMFVPAFVVRACRLEYGKVAQDTRLSPSTRKHLLAELTKLQRTFDASSK